MKKKINIALLILILGGTGFLPIQGVSSFIAEETTSDTISQGKNDTSSEISSAVIESESNSEIKLEESTVEKTQAIEESTPVLKIENLDAKAKSENLDINLGEDNEKLNVSPYENEAKIEANAGEQSIAVEGINPKDLTTETNYIVNSDGTLTKQSSNKSNTNQNTITVKNNEIVSTNTGIIQTKNGYDNVNMMYNSIEDAQTKTNGTTISGGAFDGTYYGSEEVDGNYYVHLKISGYEGYMNLEDVQIIPSNLIKSQSYYENIDGVWYYNEAISPLTSTKYTQMPMDTAPDWSVEGVKYYSDDDESFTTDSLMSKTSKSTKSESYTYFQNLPFRSTSNYSGSQYQSYLKYKGFTNSGYYNATNSFVEAQDKNYINSLLLFAMANHEGYYGTSNLSKKCNNFFGRGAYDSNPDNACINFGFTTARDGILAQGIFLTQNYADVDWFGYHGTEPGNKSHGMNVSYASDPNWGKSLATMMYSIDAYLGGHDNKYYRIYEVKNSESFYTSSSLSSTVKKKTQGGTEQNYYLNRNDGKNPRVVVTGDTGSAFEAQVPMAKNVKGESYCTWTDANKGSYSNYDGWFGGSGTKYSNPVNKNTANFACDYDSWTSQQSWYPKKDAEGNVTYNVINNVSAKIPGNENGNDSVADQVVKKEYYSNGKLKYIEKKSSDALKITKSYYLSNGNQSKYNETVKYTNGKTYKSYTRYYHSNNRIKASYDTRFASTGEKTAYFENQYSSNGKHTKQYSRTYYSNGKYSKTEDTRYNSTNGYLISFYDFDYFSNGNKNKVYKRYYNSNNTIKSSYDTRYDSETKKIKNYFEYQYNSYGKIIKKYKRNYHSNGKYAFSEDTRYTHDDSQLISYTTMDYNSSGIMSRKYYRKYKDNNQKYYYEEWKYNSSGKQTMYKKYYY